MQASRARRFACRSAFAGCVGLPAAFALAQGVTGAQANPAVPAYPVKVVRIVDAFPPGGGSDVVARLIAPKLIQAWGQQVLVENRGGANGTIGNEHVLRSAPDGYTVLIATGSYAANPSLRKLPSMASRRCLRLRPRRFTPLPNLTLEAITTSCRDRPCSQLPTISSDRPAL